MTKDNTAVNNELNKFNSEDMLKFIDFSSNAAAYGFITSHAQNYMRNIQVADLLNTKFLQSGIFNTAKSAQEWLNNRLSANPDSINYIYSVLQGHGAGEVDFVRYINGSLKSLLYKAEYATNEAGKIVSNVGGVDLVIKNRFTDEIIQRVQVKSNWTNSARNIKNTLDEFLKNKYYSPDIVLVGPQELIDEARKRGIPNPLRVFNSADDNLKSAEHLQKYVENGKLTNTVFSVQTLSELGKGALIGGAVSLGVSAIQNYIALKNGEIDIDMAFTNIAKDSARGAVVGVALKGVALLCPPGLVGIGLGIIIGSGLRKVIDAAFGKGDFEELVRDMRIDQGITNSYTNFAITTYNAFRTQKQFASEMKTHANNAALIDQIDKSQDIEIEKRMKEI
ncbi:MAG: hypothetical protein BWX75_00341 [Candidatus Cloacimonetes bacterium ADurb.Bin088]|nr:MAG: hypothetical protein BWX75_00341 [Candidatus Cloacimonetes bacterium ADurb.Bin088]